MLTTSSTSLPIEGLPAIGEATSSVIGNVVFAEFLRINDVPLPQNYVDIDKLVARTELVDSRRAALERARIELAEERYSGVQPSLSVLRLKKGWSQKRLAQELHTSQPHVARIESGCEDLRVSTVKKLAVALGVTVNQVISAMEVSGS